MLYRETDICQAQWGDGMIAVFLKHFHTLMSERKWERVFVTCSALLEISQKVQEKENLVWLVCCFEKNIEPQFAVEACITSVCVWQEKGTE